MTYDVLVVGVGLAGLVAGLRLAQTGRRVLIVAKGMGGTHLGPGTIDVLGYSPERVDHPLAALPNFLAAHPRHPYARAGLPALEAAADWFLRLTDDLGYPIHRLPGGQLFAAHRDRLGQAVGAGAGQHGRRRFTRGRKISYRRF